MTWSKLPYSLVVGTDPLEAGGELALKVSLNRGTSTSVDILVIEERLFPLLFAAPLTVFYPARGQEI